MWPLSKQNSDDMQKVLKLLRPQVRKWRKRYSDEAIAAALAQVAFRDLEGASPSCKVLAMTADMLSSPGTDSPH